jgi:hypothetical protein
MTRVFLLALLAASACRGARPYERGVLASPLMRFDVDPEATLCEQHVFAYREGSIGGYGGGGGGCGCN